MSTTPRRHVALRPPKGFERLALRELFDHRELVYFFAWRDIKVRYTQAILGAAWAVLQPLLMMAVFTVFLGRYAKVPSDGYPYAVFSYAGLLPWMFFANAVGGATQSLVGSANVVSKVYFPKLALPTATMLSFLPDLFVSSLVLVGLMLLYGLVPEWTFLLLPAFAVIALSAAASIGYLLAALNVTYRDVRYAVPFLLQLWMFATPVVYPTSLLPDRFHALLGLNPMTGVVEGARWALLGGDQPPWGLIGLSLVVSLVLLVAGLTYFRRTESSFADVI